MKQLSFLPRVPTEYGGTAQKGRRKTARPFQPKLALHVTLRSSRARGSWSMLRQGNKARIYEILEKTTRRHRVRVYRFANVGNHLHLLIQARHRSDLRAFLREFAGVTAAMITGATKGRPEKFWDATAWSKIVNWGRQFQNTARYVLLNVLEGSGLRDRVLLARLEREGIVLIAPAPST